MTQDPAWTNNQVVHPRSDGVNLGRADENTKRIVVLRHTPWSRSRLSNVHLAAPAGHDDVIAVAARAREAQTLPERDRRLQVVAGNNGKSAYRLGDGHPFAP